MTLSALASTLECYPYARHICYLCPRSIHPLRGREFYSWLLVRITSRGSRARRRRSASAGLADADSSDMSVVENFVVSGCEWTVMDTGSGNDHLVRRVLMEGLWQASRLDHNGRGEVKQPQAGVGEGDSKPLCHVLPKLQPPIFDQLGDL